MQFRLIAFAAVALSTAAPVMAADIVYEQPSPPIEQQVSSAYDWSGFYLGAQGGYNWNQATLFGSEVDLDSGSVGAHAGYNFQRGNFVFGIENDFNYNVEDNGGANAEWDASGRGRVGYALDRTLFFATAGVAAAGVKVDSLGAGKEDDILIGWTAGGGVEHALSDNILIRGEYRYTDFGNKDFGSTIGEVGATQQKILIGASYKF